MKKIFALLLTVIMVFSLAACGDDAKKDDKKEDNGVVDKKDDEKKEVSLVGDWTGDFEVPGMDTNIPIDEEVSIKLPDPKFVLNLSFTATTASFSIDRSSVEKYVNDCAKAYKEQMTAYLQSLCDEAGVTMDDFIEGVGYESLDQFLDYSLEQGGFGDSMIESINSELDGASFKDVPYTYDGSKIILKSDDVEDEITVKSLTADKLVGEFDFGEGVGVQEITFKK